MRKSFYCRAYTTTSSFTEEEQNIIEDDLKDALWTDSEICSYIHSVDNCEKQCESCMNEMLDNRSKTRLLVDKLKNKKIENKTSHL